MVQSTTVIIPSSWDLLLLAKCITDARNIATSISITDNQLSLSGEAGNWVRISEVRDRDFAIHDCETNSLLDKKFREEVSMLRFFVILFEEVHVTRRILRCIAEEVICHGDTGWIDTDYGWVMHMKDFLASTEQDPTWDWRHELAEVAGENLPEPGEP